MYHHIRYISDIGDILRPGVELFLDTGEIRL